MSMKKQISFFLVIVFVLSVSLSSVYAGSTFGGWINSTTGVSYLGTGYTDKSGVGLAGMYTTGGNLGETITVVYVVRDTSGEPIATYRQTYGPVPDTGLLMVYIDTANYTGQYTVYASRVSGSASVFIEGVIQDYY